MATELEIEYARRGVVLRSTTEEVPGFSCFRLLVEGHDELDDPKLDDPTGHDLLQVRSFRLSEWVGRPFCGQLSLAYQQADPKASEGKGHPAGKPPPVVAEMKGKKARLILWGDHDGSRQTFRQFWGELQSFRQVPGDDPDHFRYYTCELRPHFQRLQWRTSCETHRGTTPNILRRMLNRTASQCKTGLFPEGDLVEFRLKSEDAYPVRLHKRQNGANDAKLICALCEEEGIAMVFDQHHQEPDSPDNCKLIFADYWEGLPKLKQPLDSVNKKGSAGLGRISNLTPIAQDGTEEISTSVFNASSECSWSEEGGGQKHPDAPQGMSCYEPLGYATLDNDDPEGGRKGADIPLLERLLQVRKEQEIAKDRCLEGECFGFHPAAGYRFTFYGAFSGAPDGDQEADEYCFIFVEHRAGSSAESYRCRFRAVRKNDPKEKGEKGPELTGYRPPQLTRLPNASSGPMPVKVIGPKEGGPYRNKDGDVRCVFYSEQTMSPDKDDSAGMWCKPLTPSAQAGGGLIACRLRVRPAM